MPAYFTHYLGGAEMLRQTKDRTILDAAGRHRTLFNLGTQGPDLLFYHRAWPWTKNHSLHNIGTLLHDRGMARFFSSCLDDLSRQSGPDKDMLSAYLFGYISHYALDAHTHPYIFYHTGFIRPGEVPTPKYTVFHHQFEAALDVLMLQRLLKIDPFSVNFPRLIQIGRREAEVIGKLYERALRETFGLEVAAAHIVTAASDMRRILSWLRDRAGLKKKLLARAEDLLGQPRLISSMVPSPGMTDKIDYLNLEHRVWSLPWDKTAKRRDSFVDLFAQGVREAEEMCRGVADFLQSRTPKKTVLKKLGNRSYSTGLDSSADIRLEWYDCVFTRD